MQAVNRQLSHMNEVVFPETHTAIFHSLTAQAGLNDRVLHCTYTLYVLLGERIGSRFEFVGEGNGKVQDLAHS